MSWNINDYSNAWMYSAGEHACDAGWRIIGVNERDTTCMIAGAKPRSHLSKHCLRSWSRYSNTNVNFFSECTTSYNLFWRGEDQSSTKALPLSNGRGDPTWRCCSAAVLSVEQFREWRCWGCPHPPRLNEFSLRQWSRLKSCPWPWIRHHTFPNKGNCVMSATQKAT